MRMGKEWDLKGGKGIKRGGGDLKSGDKMYKKKAQILNLQYT